MNKNLILITHAFPYAPPSEQFLQTELKYLSKEFDKVCIIAVSRSANTTEMQNIIFNNVYVYRLKRKNKAYEIFKSIFTKAIFNKNLYVDINNLIKHNLLFNKEASKQLVTYHTNAYIISENIENLIYKMNFNKNDKVILYSYWLSELAYSCSLIKDKLIYKGYKNVKAVSRAHGPYDVYVSEKMKNIKPCLNYQNQKLDSIYSISKNGYMYLKKIGFKDHILKISHLGVEGIITKCELNRDSFEIVSCSKIIDIKRVDKIVKALMKLNNLKIKWTHFGHGPLFKQIKLLCEECLPDNIDWTLKGKTNNENILEYYKNSQPNLFINVSSIEGIPVSIMEAISFGIPVIAADVGGTSEAVINNFNGYLLKKDFHEDELADLIEKIINMEDENYLVLCQNSRQIWDDKFNADKNYNNFVTDLLK